VPIPLGGLNGLLRLSGRRHRRATASDGIAHIEVKAGRRPESAAMAEHLKSALQSVKGVHWAEVNGVLGRVVVSFEDGEVDPDALIDLVAEVEEAHDVHEERFGLDREEHPADRLGTRRALIAIAADAAGIGVSVAGTVLRLSPVPIELASAVSLVDGIPRLRHVLEERLGTTITDVGLSVTNAVAQGLGAGPFGLVVDMLQRSTAYTESRAEEQCFDALAEELHEPGAIHEAVQRRPRPVPLPAGPIEKYADRAGLASMLGVGGVFLATMDPRRSAAMLLAGMPKAAKLGRDAYAAQLGRTLSRRRVVVLDQGVLRRLDRIDTIVIDGSLVLSGRVEISEVLLTEGADHVLVHRHLATMFDGSGPQEVRRHAGWAIGPLARLDVVETRGIKRLALQLGTSERYGVVHDGELRALFGVADELEPGVRELIQCAEQAGLMVAVAGGDLQLVERIGAHLLVASGERLAESLRVMQLDGCAVALVAGEGYAAEALAAADCGVGLVLEGEQVPWAGDLLCPNGLRDAEFVVAAITIAREVSRQSAALALAGSSVAAAVGLLSPPLLAGGRAMTTVNVTSVIALANGTRAGVGLARRPEPRTEPQKWHELPVAEVLTALDSGPDGLSEQAARHRLEPEARGVSSPVLLGRSVLEEMANPLTPVLAGGAALSAAVGSSVDAAIVAGVTGFGSLIGGVQRFQAQRAVSALERRTSPIARVVRGGLAEAIDADSLVVGDVLALEAGDAVPADCRIIGASDLEVDESSLTGESVPVAKDSLPVFASVVADRTSMLYEGTTVAAGDATGVVVAVGAATEANSAVWAAKPPPPGGVEMRLRELTAMTIPFAAAGGAAVLGAGVLRGLPLASSIGPAVSLAVAAIPEGLPVLATAAQLAAARRLSARDTVVRNPRALEALGRVDVLCADKTGTLTEGRIELTAVAVDGRSSPIDECGIAHRRLVAAALRASPHENGDRPLPHMTDEAVVRGARRIDVSETEGAEGWERIDDLPFESSRGFHATLGRVAGSYSITVKGAPEELLGRCSRRLTNNGRRVPLDHAGRVRVTNQVDAIARHGLRVLAVAEGRVDSVDELVDEMVGDLDLLGLIALADPVRATAAEAVSGIQAAGVRMVMVTGDHPSTAEGIAAELGILDSHRTLSGAELARMSDRQLDEILDDISVFARVTPSDKVRIVAAYQRAGRTVAMTGDGANDAPAMRLADVGLAIGRRCTPAARDAADVVITDDRIETIVHAIVEGRALWAAVRDALGILLGGNVGEILFTAGAAVITGRSPLNARQILLVNLLTDIAPALTIAVRPPANITPEQLAAEGPDLSLAGPLRRAIMLRAATTASGAAGAYVIASATGRPHRASTTALIALVGTQLGQTVATSYRHPATVIAAVGSAAVLAGIVQTPGLSQMFGCTPLGPVAWVTAVGSSTVATAAGALVQSLI
jgi:cation-transporting P-type ATPase I